jgi:hypothetical protein
MEVEEIQQGQACKFPRVGNGRNVESNKIGSRGGRGGGGGGGISDRYHPDDEEDGELKSISNVNRLRGWHHSSRIIRVSRASGGKDRHSKVMTSKGLRDRRVRLSVTTAIQFYDLQDRLGYDQPSKAVEWLIKAAADAINELPSLNSSFPDTPKQLSDEKRASEGGFDSAEVELDGDPNFQQNQSQHLSLSKSACSSTSETSKGSGLSLSRSEIRVKARERARERAAKEKEKENDQNVNHIQQNSSFTELLTGGISSVNNNAATSPAQNPSGEQPNLFHKAARQWPAMDYFDSGLLGPSSRAAHHSSGFSGQIHLGNSLSQTMTMSVNPAAFNVSGDNNHLELQHFSLIPEHLIPVAAASSQPAVDYNLNFTISSSGLAGYNRGTLQSNSPSLLPHLQRFPAIDGSPHVPFFMASAAASGPPPMENHQHHHHHHQQQQFSPEFDGRLQLCYGDSSRHSDQKGKGKN